MPRSAGRVFLALLLSAGLASCAVGDGLAHVAKLGAKAVNGDKNNDQTASTAAPLQSVAPSAPQPAVATPPAEEPPPPAAGVPTPSVSVESLPPVK
jgi:hypothetical protein